MCIVERQRRKRVFGWLIGLLVLGLMALGFPPASFAQYQNTPGKGLYSAGLSHFFQYDQENQQLDYWGGIWDDPNAKFVTKQQYTWSSPNFPNLDIAGGLGACVFNETLYCFYVTSKGYLCYKTINPATGAPGPLQTQIMGVSPYGAAAAVFKNAIYVFTVSGTFMSADGQNFTRLAVGPPPQAMDVVDAVTFYPADGGPPRVMVVYLDSNSNLVFSEFTSNGSDSFSPPQALPTVDQRPFVHGNLILGTADAVYEIPGGAKAPCIQLYGSVHTGYALYGTAPVTDYGFDTLARWEYNLQTETWSVQEYVNNNSDQGYSPYVAPWFITNNNIMHLNHLVMSPGNPSLSMSIASDCMIPQHNDPNYGWDGVPTTTADAGGDDDKSKKLRSLWSLVGIVLGPSPYAVNGQDESGLSYVNYGKDESQSVSVTHTSSNTISVGTETKIQGGMGEANLDFSYAHGWTSSHGTSKTVEVSTYYTFGTPAESSNYGTHGYAIFNCPILVTQQYKIYAYDGATYLGQDMYTTSTADVAQRTGYFDLQNPSDGNIQDLFQGLTPYPYSKDLHSWYNIRNWNSGGSDWKVIFGNLTSPGTKVDPLNGGPPTTVTYTKSDSTMDSKGNTNSFSVSAGASFDILEGFSAGTTMSYDAEFETTTEIDSTITNSVSCTLDMAVLGTNPPPGYIKNLTVQPYWLQATSDQAPWIPAGYSGNLPWCLTWNVTGYTTIGENTLGASPPPQSAAGAINLGGAAGHQDTYQVVKGRLAWLDGEGGRTWLEMTADQFLPRKGASVSVNGHVFKATLVKGHWSRKRSVWTYRTYDWVKEPFALELNFFDKTWSFSGSSNTLARQIKPGDSSVRINLELQGSYAFTRWLKHRVDTTWQLWEKKEAWAPYGVHKVQGSYKTNGGEGQMVLEGHLPKESKQFGDFKIVINGVSTTIPLLRTPNFLNKMDSADVVIYEANGLFFQLDFHRGKWVAYIYGHRFKSRMCPRGGSLRVRTLVGGVPSSDQTFEIKQHSTSLAYGG